MDEMKSGECLKDCCKEAVDAYKKKMLLKKSRRDSWFGWTLGILLTFLIMFGLVPAGWYILLVTGLCWIIILGDFVKWMYAKK